MLMIIFKRLINNINEYVKVHNYLDVNNTKSSIFLIFSLKNHFFNNTKLKFKLIMNSKIKSYTTCWHS